MSYDELKQHPQFDPPFTVEMAANYLSLSKDWVYRNKGEIGFSMPTGKNIYFSLADLNRWKERNKFLPPTATKP